MMKNHSENPAIEQIRELLMLHRLPVQIDLWDAATIAAYLKCSRQQVLRRFAPLPSFPSPIRLETADGGHAQPRWRAREIIAWAERQAA